MPHPLTRRTLLTSTLAAAALPRIVRGEEHRTPAFGTADRAILLWLGGGACQIDTFDPKRMGDAKKNVPGSYYPSIPTAIDGVRFCEHLPRCADIADRLAVVRTVHHGVIDEHSRATNRMHTGRNTSGTVVYPSIGSVVARERGAGGDGVPPYVLLGTPSVSRGPGFLGAAANFVAVTDPAAGPVGLSVPRDLPAERRARRERLLARVRADYRDRVGGGEEIVADYDATLAESLRLAGPAFNGIFELGGEPPDLRTSYGEGFGQRCLLARRLVERGVRFVEVSHDLNFANGTGWDTHREGQLHQHVLIRELDAALASLITDLETKRLLDRTVILVATEFGRPAGFDGKGGRGHHGGSFTCVLAGGGVRTGRAVGETDELGMSILSVPVGVPDLHATVYQALGIDPHAELYAGERPVPVTDGGTAVAALFG